MNTDLSFTPQRLYRVATGSIVYIRTVKVRLRTIRFQIPQYLNVGLLQVPAYVKAGCFKFRKT